MVGPYDAGETDVAGGRLHDVALASVRRRPLLLVAALAVLGVAAWLAFGWFGVQQLVLDDEVDEPAPFLTASPTPEREAVTAPPSSVPTAAVEAVAVGSFIDRSHPTKGRATVIGSGGERVLRLEDFRTDNGPDLNVYLSAAPPDAPAGSFKDDYVDLGDLKGNVGAQNYTLPAGVDLSKYRTVVVWCVRFSVAFGAAGLT